MTCKEFGARLEALEAPQLPTDMAAHASSCLSCAAEAASYLAALKLLRLPDLACSVDLAPRLEALLPFIAAPRRSVAMRDWLFVGLIIFASMIFVPLLAEYEVLSSGSGYNLSFSIVLGIIMTLYASFFIASHLDIFANILSGRGHAR